MIFYLYRHFHFVLIVTIAKSVFLIVEIACTFNPNTQSSTQQYVVIGLSINDVTQFRTIYYHSWPHCHDFCFKALVLSSQNPWHPTLLLSLARRHPQPVVYRKGVLGGFSTPSFRFLFLIIKVFICKLTKYVANLAREFVWVGHAVHK